MLRREHAMRDWDPITPHDVQQIREGRYSIDHCVRWMGISEHSAKFIKAGLLDSAFNQHRPHMEVEEVDAFCWANRKLYEHVVGLPVRREQFQQTLTEQPKQRRFRDTVLRRR